MIKVEVTAFGLGLNIVLGGGGIVLWPRPNASCSITNSDKIKHSWIKLNKIRTGHDKKPIEFYYSRFFILLQYDGSPKGHLSLCQILIEKEDPQEQPCWA